MAINLDNLGSFYSEHGSNFEAAFLARVLDSSTHAKLRDLPAYFLSSTLL
jgi:hypothetical protein